MRATTDVLREARAHVGAGWSEPLSLDAAGKICGPTGDGLERFCVFDALQVAARFVGETHLAAEDALVEALRVRSALDLTEWLEVDGRKQGEVVQLFGRALARLNAKETR